MNSILKHTLYLLSNPFLGVDVLLV